MPGEAAEEDGLPKNPDLQLIQWRFLLSVDDGVGVNKSDIWEQLLKAIKENGSVLYMASHTFYIPPSLPPPPLSLSLSLGI